MTLQQTMSEKEMYLATFEREHQITLKVLRAYPADKADLKPAASSQSAREVAWTLVQCENFVEPILRGDAMPSWMAPAPATWSAILAAFEDAHKSATARIAKITDEEMNGTVRTMIGPKQEGDLRAGNMLWGMLSMSIHHRGQLSVYLRMAGGKVPSIYGPSGDEPW